MSTAFSNMAFLIFDSVYTVYAHLFSNSPVNIITCGHLNVTDVFSEDSKKNKNNSRLFVLSYCSNSCIYKSIYQITKSGLTLFLKNP